MTGPRIRPVRPTDEEWIGQFTEEHWGASFVVAHGVVWDPRELPGFFASDADGRPIGLVTYQVAGNACEIVTLNSVRENRGVGTALLNAVREVALQARCSRIWLVTTNDNLRALGFYQRRGYHLVAVHRNALERSRELKPSIPLVSPDGIPLRDELELEYPIGDPI
jgi:ribosomal protein S18 acetylase RimI-like enzyme